MLNLKKSATIMARARGARPGSDHRVQGRPGAGELGAGVEYAATAPVEELLSALGSSERGIDPARAAARLAQDGPNEPTAPRRAPAALRLAASFASPFTLILVALAAISLYTNVLLAAPGEEDPSTCVVIAVMVVVSGVLGFVQEDRGVAAAEALGGLVTCTCCVERAGEPGREVAFSELVVGDVVRLAAGDLVPADARVIEAKDLFVNQAVLTGEGEGVEKLPRPCAVPDGRPLSVTDCDDVVFTGTTVVSGSARAVVVATGDDTYVGRVAASCRGGAARTSFDAGVASVSRVLVAFMLVMCPVVFLVNGLTKGDWLDALLFSVSVAVGITPQMLPVIVTTCLARGARVMARNEVIVKSMPSIQNLGAMDVLCCDKTGTLTEDRVVLERHLNVDGEVDDRVLRHAYLVSHFQTGLSNLIDEAIVERVGELSERCPELADVDARYRKVDEVPFDFERRRMSVVVADGAGKTQMVTKGAVEEVLAACSHVEAGGRVLPLDDALRSRVLRRSAELGERGLRTIAVAQKTDPRPVGAFGVEDERDMVLIGYLAFLDPPKASATEAVARLAAAGVSVRVLTGDTEGVAAAVCRKVGIRVERTLLGPEVDSLDDAELARRAEGTQLFARLSPLQKARVVSALRAGVPGAPAEDVGHVVGFMGDGINDAAAMRASDVGISVDTAVDVAKESADVILARKDLAVLGRAVREGRRTYGNTIKYIKVTASSNFGNVLSVLAASAFLPFLPMSALQLLLLGLVYTLSCAAIPWDRMDEEFLASPRRWDARSIVSFMLWMGPTSSVFDLLTFAALFFLVAPAATGAPWAELAAPGDVAGMAAFAAVFHTGWFVESLWTQTLVLHTLRTERVPYVQSRPAPALAAVTVAGVLVVSVLPYVGGVADALGLVALPAAFYPVLVGCVVGYLALVSWAKGRYVRRFGSLL